MGADIRINTWGEFMEGYMGGYREWTIYNIYWKK